MSSLIVLSRRRVAGTGRLQQTVIFTRFYDTLTDIVDRLRRADPGMLIGTYSGHGGQYVEPRAGRLVTAERDDVKHRFVRRQIDVLICTDAAAEGLNLQTADVLVNFDLPWNPMKVEQRIGRIDRIGQEHTDIYVLNLCYADSAEHIVYGRLLTRLAEIGAIVGTQQLSLLPVTREEFQQLADKTLTGTELEQRATERALWAHRRTASMEMPPQDLYSTYLRLEQQRGHTRLPVDLDTLWDTLAHSAYLRALGCRVLPDVEQRIMLLARIPNVPDGTVVTTSRTTFEVGVPELEGRLHFATYGNPVFDALLAHLATFDLPECIRRLEADVPDLPVKVVGYAVAHGDQDGTITCRLVTAPHELATLQIHEGVRLTDTDIAPLRQTLMARVREAYQTTLAVSRIEALNEAAGRSQAMLASLVIRGIILSRQRTEGAAPLFWREIAALEDLMREPDCVLRVRRIPSAQADRLSHLLFDMTMPTTGDESYLDASRPLLVAALEAAYRLANGMKVKKSELSTDDFLARLHRVIERGIF